ncbi:hypothetical protein ACQ4M3_09840 [Leptolyngbya sp. AN03gr2]|uniref:hypothetical protein n=1 Tax=Leptolyngbya sp. AN03gr2 TaxID=3423364 RepID=UPI003D32022D
MQTFEIGRIHIYVKYSSVKKRTDWTGGCFARGKVQIKFLKSLDRLKEQAYQLAIAAQQQRVQFRVERQGKKVCVPDIRELRWSEESSQYAKGLEHVTPHSIFVRRSFDAATASQETLATNLARNPKTVRRFINRADHVAVFQRISEKDIREGYRITFRDPRRKKNRTKLYLARPNYYFVGMEAKGDHQLYGKTNLRLNKQGCLVEASKLVEQVYGAKAKRVKLSLPERVMQLGSSKIIQLATETVRRFIPGVEPNFEGIRPLDLASKIVNTLECLTEQQKEEFTLILKRIESNKTGYTQSLDLADYYKEQLPQRDLSIPSLDID